MMHRDARVGPGYLFAQFACREALQQSPEKLSIRQEPLFIDAKEMACQAGVRQMYLGGLDQSLPEIMGPGRQAMNQEDRFEQGQIAGKSRVG